MTKISWCLVIVVSCVCAMTNAVDPLVEIVHPMLQVNRDAPSVKIAESKVEQSPAVAAAVEPAVADKAAAPVADAAVNRLSDLLPPIPPMSPQLLQFGLLNKLPLWQSMFGSDEASSDVSQSSANQDRPVVINSQQQEQQSGSLAGEPAQQKHSILTIYFFKSNRGQPQQPQPDNSQVQQESQDESSSGLPLFGSMSDMILYHLFNNRAPGSLIGSEDVAPQPESAKKVSMRIQNLNRDTCKVKN